MFVIVKKTHAVFVFPCPVMRDYLIICVVNAETTSVVCFHSFTELRKLPR